MATVVVTGSGGLVGSESVAHFAGVGYDVIGLENDMRAHFFGEGASTQRASERLGREFANFESVELDIRDAEAVSRVFAGRGADIELVIHAAAQPSHDWAATDPHTDFSINANGTLNLLEATRQHAADATFLFTSTNKVYGNSPNFLPLVEHDTRLDLPADHHYYAGIDTSMSIDRSLHSLFGVSKAAADLMVQEYGRYFGLATVCFRGGCLTGPGHAGTQLHGFLSYLVRCVVTGTQYTIFGNGGKQVRDNIHSADLIAAFDCVHRSPVAGAVYNIGGGRSNSCSVLEAIELCELVTGEELAFGLDPIARRGDHCWWITDLRPFEEAYPDWRLTYDLERTVREIVEANADYWLGAG